MKKILFIYVFCISLTSCKSDYELGLEKFEQGDIDGAMPHFYTVDSNDKDYEKAQQMITMVQGEPEPEEIEIEELNLESSEFESNTATAAKEQFHQLYDELMIFKDNPDFHEYGFAPGYIYNKWLLATKRLRNDPEDSILINAGYPVIDLQTLGFDYIPSQGKENKFSRYFKSNYKHILGEKRASR